MQVSLICVLLAGLITLGVKVTCLKAGVDQGSGPQYHVTDYSYQRSVDRRVVGHGRWAYLGQERLTTPADVVLQVRWLFLAVCVCSYGEAMLVCH